MSTNKSHPTHTILDGKVHVFMRDGSPFWWGGFHFKGKYLRTSTKQKNLDSAKTVAQQWYFQKQTEIASGEIISSKHKFGKLADEALANYKKTYVDRGVRSQKTYDGIEGIMKSRVKEYFEKTPIQAIDNTLWHKYKEDMITKYPKIKRGTLHQYKNAIRVVLNYAYKMGYIKELPIFKDEYTTQKTANSRPYFSQVVKNMVGKVLTKNHEIATKDKDIYSLIGSEELSNKEAEELIQLCEQKIAEFEAKRGDTIWNHRRRGHRPISGSIRYEVLSRARGRCELCGITNEQKMLEVDHIFPKSLGGKDDLSNYQALCYSCNAAKRNTDDTDFRLFKTLFEHREEKCLFCDVQSNDRKRVIAENNLAYAIRDGFPVTEGHTLFMPKRHVNDYFGLVQSEVNAINLLVQEQRTMLMASDSKIEGFNIGMNCGEVSGQTVFHCHVHLIPRRRGDVANPRGGVRHIIADKGFYEDKK